MAAKKPVNTLASRLRAAAPKTKASTTNTKQAKTASTNPLAKRIAALSSKENDKKKKNDQSDGKSEKVNPLLAALSNATSKKTQNQTSKQKKPSTNNTEKTQTKKAPLKIGKAQPTTRSKTIRKPSLQILSSKSKEAATALQISNLSPEIPYADLFRFFSTTYGPLLSLKTQDLASGSQIASASFLNIQDMYRCEKELKEREVDGRVLTVKRISEPLSGIPASSGGSMNPYPTAGYYNPYAAAVMQFAAAPQQHMTQEQMLVQAQFQRINGATSGVNTTDSGVSNSNSRQRDTKGSKGNKKSQDLSSRIGRK